MIFQFHCKLVESLKQLSFDKSFIITKSDKGSGMIFLDKSEYIEKMENISNDHVNFSILTEDVYKTIIKDEEYNNRLVNSIFKMEV